MPDKDEWDLEQDYVCSITPTEFEKYCKDILLGYAEEERLPNFQIIHDTKHTAHDGTYQIDLYATFTAMSVEFKVLCECKQYKTRVNREKVVILADKIKSLGAHKGILLSTSSFQCGAIQYAKEHGIALIQVFDKNHFHHSFASGSDETDENDPFLYRYNATPPYRAVNYTAETEMSKVVCPTRSMIRNIYSEMFRLIREQYGLEIDLSDIEGRVDRT